MASMTTTTTTTGEDGAHRKRSRRDEKPAEIREEHHADQDRRHQRRLQDAPAVTPDDDVRRRRVGGGAGHRSSESTGVPRSRSYFQRDEEHRSRHRDDSLVHRSSGQGRWTDHPKEQSKDFQEKAATNDSSKKGEKTQSGIDKDDVWRHDRYQELEADAPSARKRPAFREKKLVAEEPAAGTTESGSVRPPQEDRPGSYSVRKEEWRGHNPRPMRRYERPFNRTGDRDFKRGDLVSRRPEAPRYGHQSRERYGNSASMRVRDGHSGRHNERNSSEAGVFQVEKWKHDLFDETNENPNPKNEEDQIAKVEALLAL